jgi:hypothetical protein
MQEACFIVNNIQLRVASIPWWATPVEALVLSANNRMTLQGASGHAGWLNKECPWLHEQCKRLVSQKEFSKGRGLPPGNGIITSNGPDGRIIIHAVSVDYDRPGFSGQPYAGIDTVSSAVSFAIESALLRGIRSLAFSPMCTRGHADMFLPRWMAAKVLPQVQAQTIFGWVAELPAHTTLNSIYFCTGEPEYSTGSMTPFQIVSETWHDLYFCWMNMKR